MSGLGTDVAAAAGQPAPYEVMVVGDYYYDLVFTGLPGLPRLGADLWSDGFESLPGAAFTTAAALTRLGVRTGWWCGFGTDLFSRLVLEAADREGLDPGLFQRREGPLRRVSAAFSFAHDRGFMSYSEAPDPLPTPADIARLRPGVLLLQGFAAGPERLALHRAARAAGALVASDCQHVEVTLDSPGVAKVLASLDLFVPNEAEALALTGAPDAEAALGVLAQHCPMVAIKCGPAGALAWHRGQRHHVPAWPVEAVDTTGAGDSFNAGLVYGLVRGQDLSDALTAAVVCGSLSTTDYGGRALPREAEMLALAARHREAQRAPA